MHAHTCVCACAQTCLSELGGALLLLPSSLSSSSPSSCCPTCSSGPCDPALSCPGLSCPVLWLAWKFPGIPRLKGLWECPPCLEGYVCIILQMPKGVLDKPPQTPPPITWAELKGFRLPLAFTGPQTGAQRKPLGHRGLLAGWLAGWALPVAGWLPGWLWLAGLSWLAGWPAGWALAGSLWLAGLWPTKNKKITVTTIVNTKNMFVN